MKLIMFDYDGVLMDTFQFTIRVYKDLSDEFNLNLPQHPEFYRDLLELDWRETLKKLNLTTPQQLKRDEEIFLRGLKEYDSLIRPYEGIKEALHQLSKKHKLAVVTNNFRSELVYRLEKYGLDRYFRAYYSYDDGHIKPNPGNILKCLRDFKVKPEEAAYVGDMDGDIIASKKARIGKIVAVTYGYHPKHRLQNADIVVDSPRDIVNVFT